MKKFNINDYIITPLRTRKQIIHSLFWIRIRIKGNYYKDFYNMQTAIFSLMHDKKNYNRAKATIAVFLGQVTQS